MGKEKLQICLSFKHTKEEEDLYYHVIGQSDKSVFLKNLIRGHMNRLEPTHQDSVTNDTTEDKHEPVINHGKQTMNKFLA